MINLLASAGIAIFDNLIRDNGEDLVKQGIEKVTGLKLDGKKQLTIEEVQLINEHKREILTLDLEKIREANRSEQIAQKNVTERWNIDKDGNFITRSVRPLILIYLTALITIMAISDGNSINILWWTLEITIKDRWIDFLEIITIAVYSSFFVGKTFERIKGRVS